MLDSGQEGYRKGGMKERRDEGKDVFRTRRNRRDAGQEGNIKGGMQDWTGAGKKVCKKGGMQERRGACRVAAKQHFKNFAKHEILTKLL